MKAQEIMDTHMIVKTIKATKHLPVGALFIVNRNLNKLQEAAEAIQEEVDHIIDTYGRKDEHGNPIILENGIVDMVDEEPAKKEYNELMSTEMDVRLESVPDEIIAQIDANPKYDALTGVELEALQKGESNGTV